MRRFWQFLILAGPLFVVACGPGQVAVTAELDVPDPESEGATINRPLADLEVQFLPFNRDQVFDSLTTAFATPEPEVPADLLALQEEISTAQTEWNGAENAWGSGRARQQALYDQMQPLDPSSGQYVVLFQEYQDVEATVNRAERVKDQAFQTFTDLQEGYLMRRDSMRIVQDQWADEAFADVFDIFGMKATEAGLEVLADTTDAQGFTLTDVPPGEYYVYAFYEQAYTELYWNLPITVIKGDPIQVRLTRETAAVRPKL